MDGYQGWRQLRILMNIVYIFKAFKITAYVALELWKQAEGSGFMITS